MTLVIEHLYSGYRQLPVIQDVNMTVESGEIVALIGLNGAGKSTLLKTILGLLPIQQGSITLNGEQRYENEANYASQIAYIPEVPILYEELTLQEHLEMTALGYGIPVEEVMERALPLLKLFRLEKYLSWFPTHFSKGMKQKVMIVCALVTNATLLIVDEPFVGLDPLAMKHFTQLLKERAKSGTSVILTTHVLSLAEVLCQRYMMLNKGKIVVQGDVEVLRAYFGQEEATLDELYIAMAESEVES